MNAFEPTWGRVFFALAAAAFGFCLPQRIPLEYFSLNTPSPGLQYIEVTCFGDFAGQVQIGLDTGLGFNDVESIRWPITPDERPYTYTFPLADAPIRGLRLSILKSAFLPALKPPCKLTIIRFRIINRREDEILSISEDAFFPGRQISAISKTHNGWIIETATGATDPWVEIRLGRLLVAEGMNERNLKRCLLSWGYLSLMIWILLLTVYFSLGRSPARRTIVRSCAFISFIAVLFSAVGNRGLIRNSILYAEAAARRLPPM